MCLFIIQKAIDAGLLLTTNEIRAQKDLVFSVTRNIFQLEPLDESIHVCSISLKMAVAWQIRQSRLHQATISKMQEFNLKLDGRPLGGMYTKYPLSPSDMP